MKKKSEPKKTPLTPTQIHAKIVERQLAKVKTEHDNALENIKADPNKYWKDK